MREFKWESIKDKPTIGGKFKRALMQFTPQSISYTRWLDPNQGYMRLVAVIQYMLIWQMIELNTFWLKHIFPLPAEHPLCVFRILMTGLISAPSTRQYYTYITDPRCKRIGTQCWVFLMIGFSELILVLKFGRELFSNTQLSMVLLWFALNILVSCVGVFVSMEIYKWRFNKEAVTAPTMSAEEKVEEYLAKTKDTLQDGSEDEVWVRQRLVHQPIE